MKEFFELIGGAILVAVLWVCGLIIASVIFAAQLWMVLFMAGIGFAILHAIFHLI